MAWLYFFRKKNVSTFFFLFPPSGFCFTNEVSSEEEEGISFPESVCRFTCHIESYCSLSSSSSSERVTAQLDAPCDCHTAQKGIWLVPALPGDLLTCTPICQLKTVPSPVCWETSVSLRVCFREAHGLYQPCHQPDGLHNPLTLWGFVSRRTRNRWPTTFMLSVLCFKVLRKMQRRHSSNTDNAPPERYSFFFLFFLRFPLQRGMFWLKCMVCFRRWKLKKCM